MAIAALTLLAVVGAALLVLRLVDVLMLMFVALVISATLRPMMSALQRLKLPKVVALLLIYLGILGVLVGLFVLVVPALVDQGGSLARGLPEVYANLVASLKENPNEVIRTLPQMLPTGDQLSSQLQAVIGTVLTGALGIGVGVVSFLAQMLTVIILSIYLGLDQSRLERFWLSLAPTSRRPELLAHLARDREPPGNLRARRNSTDDNHRGVGQPGLLGDWLTLSHGTRGAGRAARVCAHGRSNPWRDSGCHRCPFDLPTGGIIGCVVFDCDLGDRKPIPCATDDGPFGRV